MTISLAIADAHAAYGEALALALGAFEDIDCVGWTTSSPELVELCRAHSPDVVLMAYELRDGTAIDCASQLRDAGVTSRFILVMAHAPPVVRRRSLDAGFEKVLSRRLTLVGIANAIRVPGQTIGARELDMVGLIEFSRRQQQVLELMGQGIDTPSIAEALSISIHTARSHVKSVLRLLEVSNQLAAVTKAMALGYLLPNRQEPV